MTQPPHMQVPEHTPISQEELNRIFNEGDWENRLRGFTKVEHYNKPARLGHPPGTSCVGRKFYDAENKLIAIVFYYIKTDGTLGASGKPIPKGLLIDGVWRYIPAP